MSEEKKKKGPKLFRPGQIPGDEEKAEKSQSKPRLFKPGAVSPSGAGSPKPVSPKPPSQPRLFKPGATPSSAGPSVKPSGEKKVVKGPRLFKPSAGMGDKSVSSLSSKEPSREKEAPSSLSGISKKTSSIKATGPRLFKPKATSPASGVTPTPPSKKPLGLSGKETSSLRESGTPAPRLFKPSSPKPPLKESAPPSITPKPDSPTPSAAPAAPAASTPKVTPKKPKLFKSKPVATEEKPVSPVSPVKPKPEVSGEKASSAKVVPKAVPKPAPKVSAKAPPSPSLASKEKKEPVKKKPKLFTSKPVSAKTTPTVEKKPAAAEEEKPVVTEEKIKEKPAKKPAKVKGKKAVSSSDLMKLMPSRAKRKAVETESDVKGRREPVRERARRTSEPSFIREQLFGEIDVREMIYKAMFSGFLAAISMVFIAYIVYCFNDESFFQRTNIFTAYAQGNPFNEFVSLWTVTYTPISSYSSLNPNWLDIWYIPLAPLVFAGFLIGLQIKNIKYGLVAILFFIMFGIFIPAVFLIILPVFNIVDPSSIDAGLMSAFPTVADTWPQFLNNIASSTSSVFFAWCIGGSIELGLLLIIFVIPFSIIFAVIHMLFTRED